MAGQKTVVLTGATGAIGAAIAAGLCKSGQVARLVLIVRNKARGEALATKLRSSTCAVETALVDDLARPELVAACAAALCERLQLIDVLINNAAVVPPARQEVDGLEAQFATNVLAYFVLMRGLLPAMPRGGRIVLVASNLAGGLDLGDLQAQKSPYIARSVYATTKQANRMLAAEAAAAGRGFAESGVSVVSCHPGVVTSPLLSNLGYGNGFNSAAQGAALPLKLAIGAEEPASGTFWAGSGRGAMCPFGSDVAGRVALWRACEELVTKRVQ